MFQQGVRNVIERCVKCKVVTPIISRGFDFKDENMYKIYRFELRPQSIKGVLHFWFRAVAPRVINVYEINFGNIPNDTERKNLQKSYELEKLKGLKYLESMIFGSQTQKAPFGLTVEYDKKNIEAIGKFERSDGRFKFKHDFAPNDLLYALYGTYSEKNNERFVVSYLKPDSHFTLKFIVKDEFTWNVIYSLLKIISVLSGFGAKVTKGFGQFEILDKDFSRSKYVSTSEIEKLLDQTGKTLIEYIKEYDKSKLISLEKSNIFDSEFPNLANGAYEFFGPIVKDTRWDNAMSKLYYISRHSRGWYRQLKYDLRKVNQKGTLKCDAVKNLIDCLEGRSRQVEISPAILGMPLQYQRLHSEIKRVTFYPYAPGENNNNVGRKPSPLRIIINRHDQSWAAYGLLLKSKVTNYEELIYLIYNDEKVEFKAQLKTTFDQLGQKIKENIKQGGVQN